MRIAPLEDARPRWQPARAVALAVLAAGLLAVLAANLPGQLSYDSVVQLADARTGVYHTWHPAVMAWLLGLGDAVLPGTAVYVTATAALAFGALALFATQVSRVGWGAPAVALLICASPLMLLEQGVVWKDVLFADAFVGAFALLAAACRDGRGIGSRGALAAAAAGLLILAVLVRQNGAVTGLFGAAAAAWIGWRARPDLATAARRRRALAWGVAMLLAVAAGATAANAALMTRRAPDDPGAAGQLRLLKLYDLVGVAKRAPAVDLSALHATGLDAHVRAATALYSPLKNDTIVDEPGITAAVGGGDPGLDAAWRGAILHQTGAWLAHRWDVFRWIWAPPDVTRCAATYAGVDGPPEVMAQLGLKSAWRGQDLKLGRYARAFVRTPLYSHACWTALALALAAVLAWRRRTTDGVVVLMLGAGLAYAATFLLIGIACDHRYLYPLDLAAMAALLHLAADPTPARLGASPAERRAALRPLAGGRRARARTS